MLVFPVICVLLLITTISTVYVALVWIRFESRNYYTGEPPESETVRNVSIQIGLGSLVTGFFGGAFASLINNPPVPTGQPTSIDWSVVLAGTILCPTLVLAAFLYSIFAPHRRVRW